MKICDACKELENTSKLEVVTVSVKVYGKTGKKKKLEICEKCVSKIFEAVENVVKLEEHNHNLKEV